MGRNNGGRLVAKSSLGPRNKREKVAWQSERTAIAIFVIATLVVLVLLLVFSNALNKQPEAPTPAAVPTGQHAPLFIGPVQEEIFSLNTSDPSRQLISVHFEPAIRLGSIASVSGNTVFLAGGEVENGLLTVTGAVVIDGLTYGRVKSLHPEQPGSARYELTIEWQNLPR